jgi:hypothetical protein
LSPGKLSVVGTYPVTSTSRLSLGKQLIVAITAAPPAISSFIVSIDLGGFNDNPPESKVMPLPMRAIFFFDRRAGW